MEVEALVITVYAYIKPSIHCRDMCYFIGDSPKGQQHPPVMYALVTTGLMSACLIHHLNFSVSHVINVQCKQPVGTD